ncbi:MAG: RimK family protein [Myxococcales bacterium]|nr:RimK family protein [Myxococcales bacterium]
MKSIVITDRPATWDKLQGVEVVSAKSYLTEPERFRARGLRCFNLCRSLRYQSTGYYVSLLAEARGHRPVPDVATIQDLKSMEIVRIRTGELDATIQSSLAPIKADEFTLSIYFGKNLAQRHNHLAGRIHALFHSPLMRARFSRRKDGRWELVSVRAIGDDDIPPEHSEFVFEAATAYFGRRFRPKVGKNTSYDLAILLDDQEEEPPSCEKAIARFVKAAKRQQMTPWIIGKDDYPELAEFDALFIRATTNVNHYTYRFARRAASEGMLVIDDPLSILRCTNKVYLAELLARHGVNAPPTMVVHKNNLDQIPERLGLPVVLKLPDSAFSLGVVRAETEAELAEKADAMFERSELIVAQAFTPTAFDWRVGLFGGEPLWVCRYHMAPRHWQIVKGSQGGSRRWGKTDCLPVGDAPNKVISAAKRAAGLIGDGLYGVDLKELENGKIIVIEINDNPTIGAGDEDAVLGDGLYDALMAGFKQRLDRLRGVGAAS